MKINISILLFLFLMVCCSKKEDKPNEQPVLSEITCDADHFEQPSMTEYYQCLKGEEIICSIDVTDKENDDITYEWSCDLGSFKNSSNATRSITWIAPGITNSCENFNFGFFQTSIIEVRIMDKYHNTGTNDPTNSKWTKVFVNCNE